VEKLCPKIKVSAKKITILLVVFSFYIKAQDTIFYKMPAITGIGTLSVSIRQADSLFLAKNFSLLASSMNIESQKAQIIQAKVYPNPIFTAEVNAYNPGRNKAFDVGPAGQKSFMVEQLILLGGKRKSAIEVAKTNAGIAELEFQDLLRNLKYELHSGLYALSQQRFLLNIYNEQLSILDKIITAYEEQSKNGNIPFKDVVRIKGVYLNLNNLRAELLKMHFEEEARIQTLLQTDKIVIPVVPEKEIASKIKTNSLSDLQDVALKSRADYLINKQNVIAAEQYLSYQKSMAVPDVNLFGSYDQRGGAFVNQVNVGLSIPIPLWNRNQGNIKASRFIVKQTEYSEQGLKQKIYSELQSNYLIYNQTISEYQKSVKLYDQNFEITLKGMEDNFQKRNVGLIEFVDFFEAYNNALAEITRIKIQLATSAEQLNLTVGKEIY
jgi:cobalt-zinc-cadmium efflux system outer membrane protein